MTSRFKRAPSGPFAQEHRTRSRQRGIAAVEFAIILPILILLMVFPIFIARALMHYSVAAKAAQSASMYLATVPLQEMESHDRKTAAVALAKAIVDITVDELHPGGEYPVSVDVDCDEQECTGPLAPTEIRIILKIWMFDDFNNEMVNAFGGFLIPDTGFALRYTYIVPYLGK